MSNKKTTDYCDSNTSSLLTVDQARKRVLDSTQVIKGYEKLSLRSSLGRVLDETVFSSINVPAYDNSAMDGYAINSNDIPGEGNTTLNLAGKSFAGKPFEGTLKPGECIRIMTGAMIPDGADTIIMQEQVESENGKIVISNCISKGDHVRYIGEDMKVGQAILQPGKLITASELGLIASLGIAEVRVKRKLRVAFFSTGDELCSVGELPEEGQIYDSNRYTLFGMLKRLDVEIIDMGVIPDIREAIRDAFKIAASNADAVITSGGVSVGEADYVKETLDELGQINFWKVAMKPGKPMAIGQLDGAAFFGVPGNPVSAMATFYQFVQPALKKMMGMEYKPHLKIKVPCLTPLKKSAGRLEYQRGRLMRDNTGQLVVESTGRQGSHILTSMSHANCFIILPAESTGVNSNELVDVEPFEGII